MFIKSIKCGDEERFRAIPWPLSGLFLSNQFLFLHKKYSKGISESDVVKCISIVFGARVNLIHGKKRLAVSYSYHSRNPAKTSKLQNAGPFSAAVVPISPSNTSPRIHTSAQNILGKMRSLVCDRIPLSSQLMQDQVAERSCRKRESLAQA